MAGTRARACSHNHLSTSIKLGFELFHRHRCLNRPRKPRQISRPCERSSRQPVCQTDSSEQAAGRTDKEE